MARSDAFKRLTATSWVRPEALNVAPELPGMPLAPHGRRALALGLDLGIIGLLSSTGMFWAVAAVGALVVQLRRPPPGRPRTRGALMWLALAVLVAVVAQQGARWIEHRNDPPSAAAVAEDDDDDAAVAAQASASGCWRSGSRGRRSASTCSACASWRSPASPWA